MKAVAIEDANSQKRQDAAPTIWSRSFTHVQTKSRMTRSKAKAMSVGRSGYSCVPLKSPPFRGDRFKGGIAAGLQVLSGTDVDTTQTPIILDTARRSEYGVLTRD